MKLSLLIGATLSLASTALAGVIAKRSSSFTFECNGQQFPNVTDCRAVFAGIGSESSTYRKPPGINSGGTAWNRGTLNNCIIEVFWQDETYVLTQDQLQQGVDAVMNTCFPSETGGTAVDTYGRYSISVRNNPTYDPPPQRMSSGSSSSGSGSGTSFRRRRKVVTSGDMAKGADVLPTGNETSSSPSIISQSKRGRVVADSTFSFGVHTIYAKLPSMRHNQGPGLPGSASWSWKSEYSVTDGWSIKPSVETKPEELLKILKISLSVDITHSTTTSHTETREMTIKCADNEIGQVYFQGYAEIWQGVLLPSGQPVTFTKPMSEKGVTMGYYAYDCMSKGSY